MMQTILGKLFYYQGELTSLRYSPNDGYYNFVKTCTLKGMKQVIITSKMMMSLSQNYYLSRKFEITDIELMTDDDEISGDIKVALNKMQSDRAYWSELKTKLEFLNEQECIDIKRISFKGYTSEKESFSLMIQVNGIFSISTNAYELESAALVNSLTRCLSQ